MNEIRKATHAQLVDMGFSRIQARSMILSGLVPTPLTEDFLKNYEMLIRHVDRGHLWDINELQATFFLARPAEQVRFMAEIPEMYEFSPEESEAYFANILDWDLLGDLRAEIGEELAALLPDEGARERIYRSMYISGAWWHVEYLKDTLKALRRITVDPDRMSAFVDACYPTLFSLYADTVQCIDRLEEIFRPEHIQEILESEPFLPREFSPHFEPECDPEKAVQALAERFPQYLRGE